MHQSQLYLLSIFIYPSISKFIRILSFAVIETIWLWWGAPQLRSLILSADTDYGHSIIRFLFLFRQKMYLIMELCEQGELADLLKAIHHFKEKEAQEIIKQLANAISYLHKNGMIILYV